MAMFEIPEPGDFDPDLLNSDRASWAEQALIRFQTVTGTDDEDAVADLLGDLMHLCRARGYSFAKELSRACYHFACETHGEGSQLAMDMDRQMQAID